MRLAIALVTATILRVGARRVSQSSKGGRGRRRRRGTEPRRSLLGFSTRPRSPNLARPGKSRWCHPRAPQVRSHRRVRGQLVRFAPDRSASGGAERGVEARRAFILVTGVEGPTSTSLESMRSPPHLEDVGKFWSAGRGPRSRRERRGRASDRVDETTATGSHLVRRSKRMCVASMAENGQMSAQRKPTSWDEQRAGRREQPARG